MRDTATIIKASYLWDGIHDKPIGDGAVLVENGLIRAVGRFNEVLTSSEAEILEFPDATLLPGLIDSHSHLSIDSSLENYLDHLNDPIPQLTLRATMMIRKDLTAGVTTCRCVGDKEFLDAACRDTVANGQLEGPRLVVATRGIGYKDAGYSFKGTNALRLAIRENIQNSADFIAIHITETYGLNTAPALSREELKEAIEESHRNGTRIAGNCVGGQGLDWALELGINTIEHGFHITTEQAVKLAKSNTPLVLTPSAVLSEERVRKLPKALGDPLLRSREEMFKCMSVAVQAGTKIALGTDGMHGGIAEDIILLTELGAPNHRALQAATIQGARICGIEKEAGSLEQGKRADLIIVAGNVLADIRRLKQVHLVMKGGEIVHPMSYRVLEEANFVYGVD